jgi:hypothetical protein
MIIVRLSGGLGNQMFQYAAALRLAVVHGATVKLDTTRLQMTAPGDTPRDYALGCFAISGELASTAEGALCRQLAKRAAAPLMRLLRVGGRDVSLNGICYVRQASPAFDSAILSLPDNVCLDGFWQSEQYFCDIRDTLKREFTLRHGLSDADQALADTIVSSTAVSLHVRRGDYLTNPHAARHHGSCDLDYYRQAVDFIRKNCATPHLFVFSDDPDWTGANLRFDLPTTYVSGGDQSAGRDLMLMRLCRHHIIANSSFSWWGAWLADDPAKVVLAPARWFADPSRDDSAIIPDTWLRL